jgi:hypothetical protein
MPGGWEALRDAIGGFRDWRGGFGRPLDEGATATGQAVTKAVGREHIARGCLIAQLLALLYADSHQRKIAGPRAFVVLSSSKMTHPQCADLDILILNGVRLMASAIHMFSWQVLVRRTHWSACSRYRGSLWQHGGCFIKEQLHCQCRSNAATAAWRIPTTVAIGSRSQVRMRATVQELRKPVHNIRSLAGGR